MIQTKSSLPSTVHDPTTSNPKRRRNGTTAERQHSTNSSFTPGLIVYMRSWSVTAPSLAFVGFAEDGGRLLDGSAGARQAALVDGQLVPAGVDRLAQAGDGQVGQLLGDPLEAPADLVELTGHEIRPPRRHPRCQADGGRRRRRRRDATRSPGWRWPRRARPPARSPPAC